MRDNRRIRHRFARFILSPQSFALGFMTLFFVASVSFFIVLSPPSPETPEVIPTFSASAQPHKIVGISGKNFRIPSNHVRILKGAGETKGSEVILHALLPDLAPYDETNWKSFEDRSAKSPLVLIKLSGHGLTTSAEERMARVYEIFFTPGGPWRSATNLPYYRFQDGTFYEDQDLFVLGDEGDEKALFLCFRERSVTPAPGCSRTLLIGDTVTLTYRFKRHYLPRWREIDRKVQDFVRALEASQR